MRGVTRLFYYFRAKFRISTHTPHARCDVSYNSLFAVLSHFYSHTSCEVWLSSDGAGSFSFSFLLTHLMRGVTTFFVLTAKSTVFLLTHLMRGVTTQKRILTINLQFLLTHLMRGVTIAMRLPDYDGGDFYSHTSCEVWLFEFPFCINNYDFYSHTSCEVWLCSFFFN